MPWEYERTHHGWRIVDRDNPNDVFPEAPTPPEAFDLARRVIKDREEQTKAPAGPVWVTVGGKRVDITKLPPGDDAPVSPKRSSTASLQDYDPNLHRYLGSRVRVLNGKLMWHPRRGRVKFTKDPPLSRYLDKLAREYQKIQPGAKREAQRQKVLAEAKRNRHLGPELTQYLADHYNLTRRRIQQILKDQSLD